MSKEFPEDAARDSATRTIVSDEAGFYALPRACGHTKCGCDGARAGARPVPLGVLQTEIGHRREELRALEREIRALAMHPMSRRKADLRRQVRAEKRFLKDLARAASQYDLF